MSAWRVGITRESGDIDWVERWRNLVRQRSGSPSRPDPNYWDRRAPSYARTTRGRRDDFLSAVEPSEGMRAQIPPRDNMTVIASTWQDAEVAKADIVICCHVLYGIEEAVPFVAKLQASARERVFVMLREGPMPHPATVLRERLTGAPGLPMPRFSDLFMLLMQMDIAPDVTFVRYPVVNHYADMEEALNDCRMLIGSDWNETRARTLLEEMLSKDGDDLVFDSGVALSGIAHWQPRES